MHAIYDALLAVLACLLVLALPVWPYSRQWRSSAVLGIALLMGVVVWLKWRYVI